MVRRSLRQDEAGSILVLVALLLPVLLGMVGLAMDAAHLYMRRRHMQGVADLAALAAAQKVAETGSAAKKAARDFAAANGFLHGSGSRVVEVQTPYEADATLVRVELRDSIPALFVRVLGIGGSRLRVQSVARNAGKPVIWAQSTSCGTKSSEIPFYFGGSSAVWTIPLHSNGSMALGGSTNTFEEKITYGCTLVANSGNSYTYPPQQVAPRAWPLKVDPTSWTCDFKSTGDFHVGDKGPWWANFDQKILKPGVYCSDRKLTLKGGSAKGRVTFYSVEDMEIGGKQYRLEAYKDNVLFYSASSTSNALVVEGSEGRMTGLIVVPNGRLAFSGSGNHFLNGSMYASRVAVSGSDWTMQGSGAGATRLIQ